MSVISGKFNIMNPCQSKVLNTAFTQVTHSNLTIRGILLCVCVCFKSSGRVAFDIWVLLVHLSSKMVFWHFSSRLQSSQWERLILTGSPETDTSQRWMLWTHTRAVAGSQPQSPLLRLMQGHIFSLGNNWWGQFSKTQKHSRLPIAFGWQSLLHSGKPRSKIDSVGPLGWRHSKWSMKAMDWIVKTDCKLPLRLSLKSSYVSATATEHTEQSWSPPSVRTFPVERGQHSPERKRRIAQLRWVLLGRDPWVLQWL